MTKFILHLILLLVLVIALSIQAKTQSIKSEIIKKNKVITQKTLYFSSGHIQERSILLKQNPGQWYKVLNIYNDTTLIKSSHYLNGINLADYEYFYNEYNLLERRRERQYDSVTGVTYYEYNDKQELRNESIYNIYGKKIRIDYEYREDGKVSSRTENILEDDASIFITEIFSYNKNGLLTKSTQLNGVDTSSVHVYTYDEEQRCTAMLHMSKTDTLNRIEWTYKKNSNNASKEIHFSSGYLVRKEIYKYNCKGFIRKEIINDYRVFSTIPAPKKVVFKHKYEYYDKNINEK